MSESISVGSLNKNKIAAVQEVITCYPMLQGWTVKGMEVQSGVGKQPLSLEETVRGAKNRAEKAFADCRLSIGLEGGMMALPETDNDYMIVNICSIFDGETHHLGKSCGFRLPKGVADLMLQDGLDLNQALYSQKLTTDPQIGATVGGIGFFTNGRINRKDFCKQSVMTALISIENAEMFHELTPSS